MPTDLDLSALAAAKLAVRRDPAAADAVEKCRAGLADEVPDGRRIALVVGWSYLALGEPTKAWECICAAVSYETGPHLTDRAALLALSEQYQDAIFNLGLRAKDRRDLPEATRWFRQYIEAGYAAHPLAAAHLGELAYWVGDKQAALSWYQYTLDHTDLPVLVEEAEQRMAELLAG